MSLTEAFDNFMSEDFESSCLSSTEASWAGSNYVVELFEDGTYRVLWSNQVGNLYDSPGIIITIPTLNEDEYDDEHGFYHVFDYAEESMRAKFDQALIDLESREAYEHDRQSEMKAFERNYQSEMEQWLN